MIRLLRVPEWTTTVAVLAAEAGVSEDRALAYLTILRAERVVHPMSPVGWGRGGRFCAWAEQVCKSHPRSSSHAAGERMHEIFVRVSRAVKVARESRDWTIYELSKRSGVDHKTIVRLETMRRRNIPFPALMLIAQALDTTVEVLAANS